MSTYNIDYTSPLKNILMEYEGGSNGLTYRWLDKNNAVIYGIPNGVGSVMQSFTYPNGAASVVKLYYHHDRLGSTGYLTDNVDGKVTSFVSYDDWGAPTMKPILRLGQRELDLVTEYTGHMYDPLLGVYYARARMYDASDRRFMAVDPVRGCVENPLSMNLYVYVLDNPPKYVDSLGLAIDSSIYDDEFTELRKILSAQYFVLSSRFTKVRNELISHSEYIVSIGKKYGIPGEMIGAIIVKEIITQSVSDEIAYADTFLRGTGHLFGLGAIFPKTAYTAWDFALTNRITDTSVRDFEELIVSSFIYNYDINNSSHRNIVLGALLMGDDEFNIETIAVVLSYYYSVMQSNYTEYVTAYYELFGCDNKNQGAWLINDVSIGFNELIYGHVLSYYNTGKDYVYRNDKNTAVRNNAGIKYATYTREYLSVIRDILYEPSIKHTY